MEFPKLAHKTSVFTADDGTVSVFSRDVYLGRPIADGLQAATEWITVAGDFIFDPISTGIETTIFWIKKILLVDTVACPDHSGDTIGCCAWQGWL